jgi:hypothetical protein
MEITLYEQVEALRKIDGVTLVYCNEPDLDIRQQVGDEPAISFNIERGERIITLAIPDSYWKTEPFTPDAAQHITDWFDFMDDKNIKSQVFWYRVSENRFVRLKGTLKVEESELPENAKLLRDVYASVEHVTNVKVRKITNYELVAEAACTEALQFYCEIDIKTAQHEPHINMYCPKNIWDSPELFDNQKIRLEEQVRIREENSKRIFG